MQYPFQRLLVYSASPEKTDIYWELDPTFHDTGEYSYQLQINRTANPDDSDWIDVGTPQTNAFNLVDFKLTDNENQDHGYQLDRYYRVILVTDEGTYVSPIEGCFGQLSRAEWKLAQEITRRELLRHKLVSVPGVYLKRKTTGAICPYCTDASGASENSTCKCCYGTGYYGGYYNPVPFHMMDLMPAQSKEIHTTDNVMTFNMSMYAYRGRSLGIPELHTDDIWVDLSTSQRFKVSASQVVAQIRRVPLVRAVELSLLPTSHIAYSIPINSINSTKIIEAVGCGVKTIDHNYGGADALQYVTPENKPIAGATIKVFEGNTLAVAETPVFTTSTDIAGRWQSAFNADVNQSYVIQFSKPGVCGPDTVIITVTPEELTTVEEQEKQERIETTESCNYHQLFF